MLHILLLLLKIIGILMLVVLGLIVLLMAVILLVPLRYRVSGAKYEAIQAEGRVAWLFHLIRAVVRVDTSAEEGQKIHIRIQIAWFSIFDNHKPKMRHTEKRVSEGIEKPKKSKNKKKKNDGGETPLLQTAESKSDQQQEIPLLEENTKDSLHEKEGIFAKLRNKLSAIVEKIKTVLGKIIQMPSNISKKLEKLEEKAENIRNKKNKVLAIYYEDANHQWFIKFFFRLRRLLIKIMPKVDRLYWHFGFDDPAATGQVLGTMSILYAFCGDTMELHPEFQEKIMEGEIKLHGKICLGTFVVFAVRSFLNKRFFSIVKQIKHI